MVNAEELKYKSWVMTWNAHRDEAKHEWFPQDYELVPKDVLQRILLDLSEEFVFQEEVGESTGRPHYQGALRTRIRVRKKTLLRLFSDGLLQLLKYNDIPISSTHVEELIQQLTLSPMQGTWAQAVEYCTKGETAVGEPVASFIVEKYDGTDVNFLRQKEKRYPWQSSLLDQILTDDETNFKVADGRSIIWIWDPHGNSGKSKLVKYLCINYNSAIKVSFGTAGQLRSAVISAGSKTCYFIDMPRTLGADDSLDSLIAVVEDILNGFVCTNFHGQYSQLVMNPPIVVVFSNMTAPKGMLSEDRWKAFRIDHVTKKLESQG